VGTFLRHSVDYISKIKS